MEKAHSTEAKAYMAFLYFFALRNSEVCRLQKSHLTYHHGNGKDVEEKHIVLSGLRVKGTEGENIIGEGHIAKSVQKTGNRYFGALLQHHRVRISRHWHEGSHERAYRIQLGEESRPLSGTQNIYRRG